MNKQIGYVQKRFESDFAKLKNKEYDSLLVFVSTAFFLLNRDEVSTLEQGYERKLKSLTNFKEKLAQEGVTFEQTVTRNKEIIKSLEKMKEDCKNISVELNQTNKNRELLFQLYQSSQNEYQTAKNEYRKKEEEIQHLEHDIKDIQGKIAVLTANKNSFSQRLPALEAEKRNYAQTRNFKVVPLRLSSWLNSSGYVIGSVSCDD